MSITITSMKTDFIIVFAINKFIADLKALIPSIKAFLLFKRILYIYYLVYFRKDQIRIQILITSGNKVNIMILVYIKKLSL